jgi:DNA repair protein RecN (Recombination protein N)
MLLELRIGNLALAADVAVSLRPGLTALTGETGAGKSMIAGALALLAGDRGDRDLVRSGEELAWVEGVFDLAARPDLVAAASRLGVPLAEDAVLVLRREIRREGRGRVLVNGLVSSLAVLERLGPHLLAVQSQDQQRELARPGFARDLLDDLLGLGDLRTAVASCLAAHRNAVESLERRRQETALAREQADLWRYQHDELVAAALVVDEEADLAERIAEKRHAHDLQLAAATALSRLDEGPAAVRENLGAAIAALTPQAGRSPRLAGAREALATAAELVAEAAHALESYLDQLDLDPRGLDELEGRKALYEELRRKYRRDVAELLLLQAALAQRLERQDSAQQDLAGLQAAVGGARADLGRAAAALRKRRRSGAPRLAATAQTLIRPLALPSLELEFSVVANEEAGDVEVDGVACRVDGHGSDRVELLARTNPGESRGSVAAVASGGERSRIHLGLTVMRQGESGGPLVRLFDEVDAGLGMDAAPPIAHLLRRLARTGQVLCITHLPTLAVHADQHLVVTKRIEDGRTSLRVSELAGDARTREIARLLGGEGYGGEDTDVQLAYARELLAAGAAAAADA